MQFDYIAFLSDFGNKDGFVSIVKGNIIKYAPNCLNIIDVSHEIPSQDIFYSSILLNRVFGEFPKKTLYLAVVDPTVGSNRKILYIKIGEDAVIAPDNGLLTHLIKFLEKNHIEYSIFLIDLHDVSSNVSSTFHGRDVFSKITAYVASEKFEKLKIEAINENLINLLETDMLVKISENLEATILYVDKFGNCYLNISRDVLLNKKIVAFKYNGVVIPFLKYYSEVEKNKEIALVNSDEYLELSINCGSFSNTFNKQKDDVIKLIPVYQ